MNILYYIPLLQQDGGGTRQYATGILKTLAKDKTKNKYFILHNSGDKEILSIIQQNPHLYLIPEHVGRERSWEKNMTDILRGIDFLYKKKTGKNIRLRSFMDRICRKYKIDIVHSPFQHNPYSAKTKNIFTLHDVQELHFPEYFLPEEREGRARNWLSAIGRSKKIVVSFDHIKNDIIKYFQVPSDNIDVVLLDMQNLWFDKFTEKDVVDTTNLHDFSQFLLYPANTWAHKNHIRLLEALVYLRDNENTIINLVCSGHKNDFFEKIETFVKEHDLMNQVKFVGIVDEQILYSLYKTALGVVVPTTYEAGSFPLVESIFLNIPVICSNVTSLPETIGNDNFTFNPLNVQDIAEKVKTIWTDNSFRETNKAHLFSRIERLKNTNAYEKILKLYESV